MGLFEKKTEDEKILEFVEKYKLEEMDVEDIKNLYEVSKTVTFNYPQGLIEQNFIIIKLLDRLNRNIEELKNK
ncbi:hypothetical protein [Ezakiella coagulans]|uniref:hypothetical protein n=1 Tax=Ezakiella coagulans TaxID=46507 RepID=UPI002014B740|nr:hypothetical protein [Ezakiella coagulans]UQK61534.1 hypothetical protein M1R54_04400 [Ezakiella coagulans]